MKSLLEIVHSFLIQIYSILWFAEYLDEYERPENVQQSLGDDCQIKKLETLDNIVVWKQRLKDLSLADLQQTQLPNWLMTGQGWSQFLSRPSIIFTI
ncbi:MAG: hypothetical protein D4R64_04845 [Porphyromonadaceae bacterium]|nr:MAG: hypothetical protein D4R64_04845 [Porphyromonadaceae bacterium]